MVLLAASRPGPLSAATVHSCKSSRCPRGARAGLLQGPETPYKNRQTVKINSRLGFSSSRSPSRETESGYRCSSVVKKSGRQRKDCAKGFIEMGRDL